MSGVKIGRLSWIFPRGPNAITRVPRRGSLKSGLEKCSVRRDLANMDESKDENTGPEDMGNEWDVLRCSRRESLECSPPWESSACGDSLSRINSHCLNATKFVGISSAAVGTTHTVHASSQPSMAFPHTALSCHAVEENSDHLPPALHPLGRWMQGFH